ncbi:hypothetical protein MKZ38_004143 [Zalerion maritima]|uniref:DNA endonuclease activator Ctp1 C-terminal domain-containing protein n=1 Tax=Zalerion maritima TaxID=339359 RepID=A0AAD5RLZ4_9PEZI|nr:hypothetical protein MKZ38_004143 [Zalerion maritima]
MIDDQCPPKPTQFGFAMDGWFKRGRPAIFDALASVCDQVDKDLSDDKRNFELKLSQSTTRVVELQNENENLKVELRALRGSVEPCSGPSKGKVDIQREFDKLHAKYTKLDENYRIVKGKYSIYKQRLEKYEKGIQSLETRPPPLEKVRATLKEAPLDDGLPKPKQHPTDHQPDNCRLAKQQLAEPLLTLPPPCGLSNLDNGSSRARSSISTGDPELPTLPNPNTPKVEHFQAVKMKEEPSSDGPIYVWERFVGKRKRPDLELDTHPKVKNEGDDLDSHAAARATHFSPPESLDLDDSGVPFPTPKKRRSLHKPTDVGIQEETFAPPNGGYLRICHDKLDASPPPELRSSFNVTPRPRSSVLTPISSMIVSKPTFGTYSIGKHEKPKAWKDLPDGIASLAEDGVDFRDTARCCERADTAAMEEGRLGILLNGQPTPGAAASLIPRNKLSPLRRSIGTLRMPARRELPFGNADSSSARTSTRTSIEITRQRPKPAECETASTNGTPKMAGGLRSRHPSELRPGDFKINPNFNDGLDYAYMEVVRGDERTQLVGCTDDHCCGKYFRSLAMTSAKDRDPTTDRALLESYLGDNCYKLSSATKVEKDELWLRAKTWKLANKYGRHRHRYERQQSPPGFWDADFPSTQELERQKVEASRREREVTENRYREAMRQGGRWLFRDE